LQVFFSSLIATRDRGVASRSRAHRVASTSHPRGMRCSQRGQRLRTWHETLCNRYHAQGTKSQTLESLLRPASLRIEAQLRREGPHRERTTQPFRGNASLLYPTFSASANPKSASRSRFGRSVASLPFFRCRIIAAHKVIAGTTRLARRENSFANWLPT